MKSPSALQSLRPSHAPSSRAPSGDQRRVYERFPFEAEVDLVSEHNFYTGLSWNISEGGLFVATHIQKPVGAKLEIRFTLPGSRAPISAIAEVRWVRGLNGQSDIPPGLGLSFVEISESALERIQAFIRGMREPLFYED